VGGVVTPVELERDLAVAAADYAVARYRVGHRDPCDAAVVTSAARKRVVAGARRLRKWARGLVSAAALATACASPAAPAYTYADTYGVPGACSVRSTRPDLVLLRCTPAADLTDACPGDSQAELWTRPGADATPYGVTGRLELTCRDE
jgi:hypothetical protein